MQRLLKRLPICLAIFLPHLLAISATNSLAQCVPHWEPVGIPDPTGTVRSMIWHDDGSGPALFVGGSFGTAAGTPALNIARLSNGVGQPLGEGLPGTVNVVAIFDDGNGPKLYAGGSFSQSGSTQLLNLASWNGSTWSPVGGGTNGDVYALASHNDGSGNALFVGGQFTSAGGMPVSNIARWNGSNWNALAGGVTGPDSNTLGTVRTLLSRSDIPAPLLYAAGRIVSVNGVPATPVVEWNGSSWSNVSAEATGNTALVVNALAMYDPGTGTGPQIHRATNSNVRRLEGTVWTGTFLNVSSANSLCVLHDGHPGGSLYIGTSSSSSANGQFIHRGLVRNLGGSTEGTGMILNGVCRALCEIPGTVYPVLAVGGSFADANGVAAKNVASYNEFRGWQAEGAITHGGLVSAYVPMADGSAYVATTGTGIARLSANALSTLPGTRVESFAFDLDRIEINGIPTLVGVGALFNSSGLFRAALAWQNDLAIAFPLDLPASQSYSASDLCISSSGTSPSLLLGGRFRLVGDASFHGLLRYSSAGISSVATDPHQGFWINRMFVHNTPDGEFVYVTDYNAASTDVPTLYILNPSGVWTAIPGVFTFQGANANDFDLALAWFDDNDGGHLYIGGRFDAVNGIPAQCIARLNGTIIEPLPMGVTGVSPLIHDLAVFDDGSGPALYAAGRFEFAGGASANNIARRRNSTWTAVAGGVTQPTLVEYYYPPISRLKTISDSTGDWLYAMGSFVVADGQLSPKVARYGRCRPCPADFNNDGTSDFFDYLDFVQAFSSNESAADFNHDSIIDFFDYLDFVAAFSNGCP